MARFLMKPTFEDMVAAAATLREKRLEWEVAHERANRSEVEEKAAQIEMVKASTAYSNICADFATEE